MTNPNDPVYGTHKRVGELEEKIGSLLTVREYFAAMAMQGLCADPNVKMENIAHTSVIMAKLLILELNKKEETDL